MDWPFRFKDPMKLGAVTVVCRHWREVALNAPWLWSDIVRPTQRHQRNYTSVSKYSVCEDFLRLSKCAPLNVCMDDLAIEHMLLLPEVNSRVRNLMVNAGSSQTLEFPAPILENLYIHDYSLLDSETGAAPLLLQRPCPQLKLLILLNASFLLGNHIQSLTHLSLRRYHRSSLPELATLLSHCTLLQELDIRHGLGKHSSRDPICTIHLPFLRRLSLQGCRPSHISKLVSALRCPTTLAVLVELSHLYDKRFRSESALIDQVLEHIAFTGNRIRLHVAFASVHFSSNSHIILSSSSSTLCISLTHYGLERWVHALCAVLSAYPVTEIVADLFSSGSWISNYQVVTQVLSSLPSLRKMELLMAGECVYRDSPWLQLLRRKSPSILCPDLDTLHIASYFSVRHRTVLQLLKLRGQYGRRINGLIIEQSQKEKVLVDWEEIKPHVNDYQLRDFSGLRKIDWPEICSVGATMVQWPRT